MSKWIRPLLPSIATACDLYRMLREWGHGRASALIGGCRLEWYAWRYTRALKRMDEREAGGER